MWGRGHHHHHGMGGGMGERISDNIIQQVVPGGLNSPMGEQLDNMLGGNPNPTFGQYYGGAPGVGGHRGGGFHGGHRGGFRGGYGRGW